MSRARRITYIALGSLGGLIAVLVVAGILIAQTQWFRKLVREKIIASIETSTGGTVDIGSFDFDWRNLRADVRDFVLHGAEPAGAAPLFRARLLEVTLKIVSPFKHMVDISSLLLDTPQANVIVYPDGHTNVPEPKIKQKSDTTALETIINLAIGHFDLRNGSLIFAERKTPLDARGENLKAQFTYNALLSQYKGQISMQPLYVRSGANQPMNIDVMFPVVLGKDKVELTNARLTTAGSEIVISGAMDHLVAPHTAAHVQARVSLAEVQRAAGQSLSLNTSGNLPKVVNADLRIDMDDNHLKISTARLTVGQSNVEASGTLKDVSSRHGALQFNARLAVGELGRMLLVSSHPEGTVQIGGSARLNSSSDYLITGNVDARGLAFQQGVHRLTGMNLDTSVRAAPSRIDLQGLRLSALGGTFNGNASLVNQATFQVKGNLNHFDLEEMARPFLTRPLPYDGVISGPLDASGNIHAPAQTMASVHLELAPGRRGVPVSGRLNADYNGRGDTVTIARSYIALPATRLDLSGTLGRQLQIHLVSRNLNDFAPAMASSQPGAMPVALQGGAATFDGTVTGKLEAPGLAGHLTLTNFVVEDRQFTLLAADVEASPSGAAIRNGKLARAAMQTQFTASVGLRNWKAESWAPLAADASIQNADVRDILALAGQKDAQASGNLTASVHITGTVGDPRGSIALDAVNATAYNEHVDQLTARAALTNRSIDLSAFRVTAGSARLDASGAYQHPQGDLHRGVIRAHVAGNQMSLDQFHVPQMQRANLSGTVSVLADATADVRPVAGKDEIQITSLNGNVTASGLAIQGKKLGDLTATAQTSGANLDYRLNSDFAGSTIRVNGQTQLVGDHPTKANAVIHNLPIQQLLAVAGRHDIEAAGIFSANADLSGTLKDPHANGTMEIAKGVVKSQPFDTLQAKFTYSNQLVDLPSFLVTVGSNRVEMSGSFTHPADDYSDGNVRFHVVSNRMQLASLRGVQQYKPGLTGGLQLAADGAATLRRGATPLFQTLNANVSASGLSVNGKPVGDLTATAVTRGQDLDFKVNSDFAKSKIQGTGQMQLQGDYPVTARLSFTNLTYKGMENWIGPTARPGFDALVEGQANLSGPAAKPQDLKASLELSKLEINSAPAVGKFQTPRRAVQLHNSGPILVTLDRSVVKVQNAKIVGPYSNLSLSGTASIQDPQSLDLRADGNIHLELAEAFDPDVFSSGTVVVNAAVQGTVAKPAINGRLQLQDASFNVIDIPNGISKTNGLITFNGSQALIQNLTAESGGGQITLGGSVAYGGPEMEFRLRAAANHVLVEYADAGTQADATINLTGTTSRSLVSGNLTVLSVAMHSHTDIGSMLSQTAAPATVPQAQTGMLANMQLDIRIDTAPNLQVRTSLAQNLQADGHLRLRGTPSRPGMLGRLDVTQGKIIFFGTNYNIDQGTVAFYNPQQIDPVLNIDLTTNTHGVDVALNVTGPMDKLKLTYRSDPPLQFSDIVALLATGKVPTTDPILAANQPPAPQQNMEQVGASALLGQAVGNPVSGRLQRLFGVSKFKIDPQITGVQNTPQARMTLEQQITRDLTFTYITDVASSNPQIIRVQWDIDPTWSAIAERQENGEFGVDFFYKKRFR
jgi:translocation and assembly module TamB